VDGDRSGFENKISGLYFEPTQIYVEIKNYFHSSQENKPFEVFCFQIFQKFSENSV